MHDLIERKKHDEKLLGKILKRKLFHDKVEVFRQACGEGYPQCLAYYGRTGTLPQTVRKFCEDFLESKQTRLPA